MMWSARPPRSRRPAAGGATVLLTAQYLDETDKLAGALAGGPVRDRRPMTPPALLHPSSTMSASDLRAGPYYWSYLVPKEEMCPAACPQLLAAASSKPPTAATSLRLRRHDTCWSRRSDKLALAYRRPISCTAGCRHGDTEVVRRTLGLAGSGGVVIVKPAASPTRSSADSPLAVEQPRRCSPRHAEVSQITGG